MDGWEPEIISLVDCFIFCSLFCITFLSCLLFGDVTIPFTSYALIDYRKSWISLGDLAKLVPLLTVCGLTEVVARSCSTILPNPSSVPMAKNYSVTINFFLWSSSPIPLSDESEK